jgi:prepilin-type N-terminal cleavage/methylation domain-containing protein/prepilin-type processing-associated H-X9-DG protein
MRNARASVLAFTLVELLVTMSIIALLAALLLPTLGRGKESGRVAACQSNLHQIGVALQLYVDDNKNIMPIMYDYKTNQAATNQTNINVVLAPQLGSTNVLRCPSDNQQIFQQTGSSYSWNNLVNGQNADQLRVMTLTLPMTRIPLVLDKQGFHAILGSNHAVNYLYADGHIKNLLILTGTQ